MSESSGPNPPRKVYQFSLRRLFLYVHIVSLTCSAVIGIGQILTGNDRDFRVLGTAVTIALASVCGLGCGAALESKRARIVPIAGLVLTLLGATWIIGGIWRFLELQDAAWVAPVYAVACAHASLLSIARLAPRYSWAFLVAFAAIFSVATLISWLIVSEPVWRGSEWQVRWIAVAAIIDALLSVLIPILHLLSRHELLAQAAGTTASRVAIDEEIARLERRLADLRRHREAAATERTVRTPEPPTRETGPGNGLKIVVCAHCHMRVAAKQDGTCPSCGTSLPS